MMYTLKFKGIHILRITSIMCVCVCVEGGGGGGFGILTPVFNIVETYSVTIDNIPTYSSVLAQSSIQQRGRI